MNRGPVLPSHRSLSRLARLAGWAVLVAGAAGCDPCLTHERKQVTLTASFSENPVFSSTRSAIDQPDAEFATWTAAIGSPSGAPAGFGVIVLQRLDSAGAAPPQLLLSLPFPLSSGQSLPIVAAVATQGRDTFTIVAPDDPNVPLPAGALGLWFIGGTTREELLDAREQSASGTATVIGVGPLRLHLTATVSYPASATGRPPVTLEGDLDFSTSETSMCAG